MEAMYVQQTAKSKYNQPRNSVIISTNIHMHLPLTNHSIY